MNDLYNDLKIDKNATSSQIKKAFRNMAKECHPDKAGDNPERLETFNKISMAYNILMDPVLRIEYDETGSIPNKTIDNIKSEAIGILSQTFINTIRDSGFNEEVFEMDIISKMANLNLDNLSNAKESNIKIKSKLKILERLKGKIIFTGDDKDNIFLNSLIEEIKNVNRIITSNKHTIKVLTKASEILSQYKFLINENSGYQIQFNSFLGGDQATRTFYGDIGT
jgi:curved DNA-binding protein CbpA